MRAEAISYLEDAAMFCWALRLGRSGELPVPLFGNVNHDEIFQVLQLMRPEARSLLVSPVLRDEDELPGMYKTVLMAQAVVRETRLKDKDEKVRQQLELAHMEIIRDKLANLEINVSVEDFQEQRRILSKTSSGELARTDSPIFHFRAEAMALLPGISEQLESGE